MDQNYISLEVEILNRIEDIGAAKEMIYAHWNEYFWEGAQLKDLSKHNDWFDSPHEEESEKLDECRRRMQYYENLLEQICNTLCRE